MTIDKILDAAFEYGIVKCAMHFTQQDRPEKAKRIYKALKREHPGMPAEMKARIAGRQGHPGHPHQGPPYTAPLTRKK